MCETIKDLVEGLTCVAVEVLDDGFVMLFEDGVVVHVNSDEAYTVTTGSGWHATWETLTR